MKTARNLFLITLTLIALGLGSAYAQENLAQQASAIFERNCLNCHGEHGAFTEEIIIEYTALIKTGAVIPGKPEISEVYKRLVENRVERRMPLGQPPLSEAAIETIRQWIEAGTPNWEDTVEVDGTFITPKEMLETIENHVSSLAPFDRAFARYFTMTHLYNTGETTEALHAYQRALSKLVNSLSWGRDVIKPQPIDLEETIFYIDLRAYEWEIGTNRWTQIEQVYPYSIKFNAPTQTALREKLTTLRREMDCEVPFVHVDWFLATASLPPLYHDILDLPETDRELETLLGVNVVENIRNAAGHRVWRAGFSDSGVSNNNRVVERHISRYGAYWKSYDFAGSVGTQNIFTHPLSFTHDGGEVVFNLPNGLQAYYLADAGGRRLDAAPIGIVSNPAASDPTVRNGLSCIGCHTEGMKTFEDQVRGVVEKNLNPPYDKARALSLYAAKATMDAFIGEDTNRYRQSLETAGGIFGGIEPIQRFHEAFHAPLDVTHAAATIGLETQTFLARVRQNTSLQNLGLLVLENGTMKRDTWTEQFSEVVFALDFPERSVVGPVDAQTERIPGKSVYIPDLKLRAVIEEALGKTPGAPITAEEMATLENLHRMADSKGISDLTGLEFATNIRHLWLKHNKNISDLSPIAGLHNLRTLDIGDNSVSDLSPLAELTNLESINIGNNRISDLSPLAGLKNLEYFMSWNNPLSDLSPLVKLTEMKLWGIAICGGDPDISALKDAKNLKELYLPSSSVSDTDISALAGLTNLTQLNLEGNNISDVSVLAGLTNLKWLDLTKNAISDFSPLAGLAETTSIARAFNPGAPIAGTKIEGPWLWVTVPGESLDSTDLLAQATNGAVTELRIATHGAIEGSTVGNNVWKFYKIAPEGGYNIREMLESLDFVTDLNHRVIYGSIMLETIREQDTNLFIGSNNGVKIWLNSELVHKAVWRETSDYKDFVPVTLKQGRNFLLVAIDNRDRDEWGSFVGFEDGTEYRVSISRFNYTTPESSIHVGDTFTLDIRAEHFYDLAGWQFDVAFDPTVLEAIEVSEGDFLKSEGATTFFQKGTIDNAAGKITTLRSVDLSGDGVTGTGTLVSLTFAAKTSGETQLGLRNFNFGSNTGEPIAVEPFDAFITIAGQITLGDINRDGQVNILDMILVARYFGSSATANPQVDLNRDGTINIQDLIIVAQHLGASTTSASPSILAMDGIEDLDPAMIQAWIEQAQLKNDGSTAFQYGIENLQRLLASLIPKETTLLANYPNPFNPETWIPYHLANASGVTITIYDMRGTVVRQLDLGHQSEGYYTSRSRAAYWDGRNAVGERVASGIYFYQLQADNVSYLQKMVILK